MEHLQGSFCVSERRASCRVVEQQPRSSQRHVCTKVCGDATLVQRIVALSRENPRYGYRRVCALLRREGWAVNKKRVQRLWREAGLQVPAIQQKQRRLGSSQNGCTKRRAEYPGHVWSYDFFAMDSTEEGRRLKIMPVVDEYSRECLSIDVERSITSEEIIDTPRRLFTQRGAPRFIRSDNGPEFIARAVRRWPAASGGVRTLYIEPGAPWENAYSETFISRMRDELLDREIFANLKEAQVLAGDYREHYTYRRPHGALSYLTPAEFTARKAERLEFVQRLSS